MKWTLALFAALPALACTATPAPSGAVGPTLQLERTVTAPPTRVIAAAADVFQQHGIQVAMRDASTGLVQGTEMTVREFWDKAEVRERFDCGRRADTGMEIALANPVRFRLGVTAQPADSGSIIRLTFNGSAQDRTPSSDFPSGTGETFPCKPTPRFAKLVLDEIEQAAIR